MPGVVKLTSACVHTLAYSFSTPQLHDLYSCMLVQVLSAWALNAPAGTLGQHYISSSTLVLEGRL